MLPPLGIIFGLLVGFIAAQVWSDCERAKVAVATEASALRSVNLLAAALPQDARAHLNALVTQHIDEAVGHEWPEMARQNATLSTLPKALIEALQSTLALVPSDDREKTANTKSSVRSRRRSKLAASASSSVNRAQRQMGRLADSGAVHLGRHRHGA